jgi:predicted phage tail protein
MKHEVKFHGSFKEDYLSESVFITADSMTMLLRILFKNVVPKFIENGHSFDVLIEDSDGNVTGLIDPEQELPKCACKLHIVPNPDGAWVQIIYAIIVAIVSIGVSLLLAPKMNFNSDDTASGANWQTAENVIGQGGTIPVLLGTRLVGSRVVSQGIDSALYIKNV